MTPRHISKDFSGNLPHLPLFGFNLEVQAPIKGEEDATDRLLRVLPYRALSLLLSLSPRHFTHAPVVFSLPSSYSSFISPRSHLYHLPHAAGISPVLFPPVFLVCSFRTRAVT